jgi:chromosome segregation ATPase
MTNEQMAEIILWQSRVQDLETSVERLREERESMRARVDLLLHEIANLEASLEEARKKINRFEMTHRFDPDLA